jgi:hypothetical protein
MRRRCYVETDTSYRIYGARGITVCGRWRDSFEAFISDMGPRPSAGHSLDRIDNDGNYEPGNCRWATRSQQMRNTRQNHLLTVQGKTMTLVEAAEVAGINQNAALNRISYLTHSMGIPAAAALCWPLAKSPSERGRIAWVMRLWNANYRRAFPRLED